MYAIVLAGGSGSRLWPRSRSTTPKQFLDLVSERSMLQETIDRLVGLMPIDNIVIVTGEHHAPQVIQQLPELNTANVIVEPAGRGTAPAIGLGLMAIGRMAEAAGESNPVIGSFTADHVITKTDKFHQVVKAAAQVAEQGLIVTLGIQPDFPHTGYGYIESGPELGQFEGLTANKVARFVEKPPRDVAEQYLATGRYTWNSGMFIWQLSTIMDEFRAHQPQLANQLAEVGAAMANNDTARMNAVWSEIKTETIDVGIAEKSDKIAVLPADIGWSDVGDWSVVTELLADKNSNAEGNAVTGHHLGIETNNSLIYTASQHKLVATIGLEDIIIVDTPDVLLVCHRTKNQDVKKIVEKLRRDGLDQYL